MLASEFPINIYINIYVYYTTTSSIIYQRKTIKLSRKREREKEIIPWSYQCKKDSLSLSCYWESDTEEREREREKTILEREWGMEIKSIYGGSQER